MDLGKQKARHWCFTLNNYEEKHLEAITKWEGVWDYIVVGCEVGEENGTPHLQGYCEYPYPVIWTRVQRDTLSKCHVEKRKKTREQASDYCKKDDLWVEYGEMKQGPGQGHRTDLEEVVETYKSTKDLDQVAEQCPVAYIKYGRGIDKWAERMSKPPGVRDVEVKIYWGESGSGKTWTAMHEDESTPYSLHHNGNKTIWFNGYNGEKTLLIDDFDGWIEYRELLKMIDVYRYQCQTKGGTVWAQWSKVIITSNNHPRTWYHENTEPLQRRISKVRYFQVPLWQRIKKARGMAQKCQW